MSKYGPNTSFIAMNDAAIPPELARNARRDRPSCFAAPSTSSSTRDSTRFCCEVCGSGAYSPFDTICVGTAVRGAAIPARVQRAISSSVSR